MTVPRVSPEALQEACSLIASQKIFAMSNEEITKYMQHYNKDLMKRQPELYAFLHRTLTFHMKEMKGIAMATSIPLFCSIVLNALYIQSEINEVGKLFEDLE